MEQRFARYVTSFLPSFPRTTYDDLTASLSLSLSVPCAGNCLMGCEKPEPYMAQLQNYTSLNYGFTFLTTDPSPDQNSCTTATCKTWNGKAIYMAASSKQGAAAVTAATTISDLTPGIVTIGEACRLARMNEWGPRRCKISLGGWSDWARIGSSANAAAIASLVGKLVAFTFSDGIDLDFEHLSTFSNQTLFPGDDEFTYFAELIVAIRKEFETVCVIFHYRL